MKAWSRDDTKEWVAQLENRIDDIEFYLKRTVEWCEENEVYSEKAIFICSVMAIIWVCHLRNEPISKHEIFEILGVKNWQDIEDEVFQFNPAYEDMELEQLLNFVVLSI